LEVLNSLPRFDSDYVFASDESASGHLSSLRRPWAAVCEKAGLKGRGWRIHDLRHAFASAAVNSGASLSFIGKLLGHSNASTTARYAHVAENPAHQVAEDTGARIADALKGRPNKGVLKFVSK
jgi:site-specific recombinase XerD